MDFVGHLLRLNGAGFIEDIVSLFREPEKKEIKRTPMQWAEYKIKEWIENKWTKYELNLDGLGLTELPKIPDYCIALNCMNNNLTKLPLLPNCKRLNCSMNMIEELPDLPECEELICHHNELVAVPNIPKCKRLRCDNNKIFRFGAVVSIEHMNCSFNQLRVLPPLPKCKYLICNNNLLAMLPYLPVCETILCNDNKLKYIDGLPCRYIDCDNNEIKQIKQIPQCTALFCRRNKLTEIVNSSLLTFFGKDNLLSTLRVDNVTVTDVDAKDTRGQSIFDNIHLYLTESNPLRRRFNLGNMYRMNYNYPAKIVQGLVRKNYRQKVHKEICGSDLSISPSVLFIVAMYIT